jgi:hypothetical protein
VNGVVKPLEVRCPTCGAPKGEGCVSVMGGRGNPCRKPHRTRVNRATVNREIKRQAKRQRKTTRRIPEQVKAAVRARAQDCCEAQPYRPTLACSGRFELHHRLRRSQGGQDTVDNLLLVCSTHHAHIHAWPEWARENGLLRGRYGRRVA